MLSLEVLSAAGLRCKLRSHDQGARVTTTKRCKSTLVSLSRSCQPGLERTRGLPRHSLHAFVANITGENAYHSSHGQQRADTTVADLTEPEIVVGPDAFGTQRTRPLRTLTTKAQESLEAQEEKRRNGETNSNQHHANHLENHERWPPRRQERHRFRRSNAPKGLWSLANP
jgi:hypothetical protein